MTTPSSERRAHLERLGAELELQFLRDNYPYLFKNKPAEKPGKDTRKAAARAHIKNQLAAAAKKRDVKKPKRRSLSAAERKAISVRMKKFWAGKRATS